MYLVQFKIQHFFILQFLHNGFIFIREFPMRTDLFVFPFYSRISRILDSEAAAWKHFYPFKYWLVPCSPRTSFRQTAYTDNNLPKDQHISISMPLQLNSPSGESLPAASVLFVPALIWAVFSPCRSSNKFQVMSRLVLLWGNKNCTNRNPRRIFHLVAVSYNKWFAVAPLWVQLSVVQAGCAVEPEDWVNRAVFGSRQFTLKTLHMVTKVKYFR